MSVPIQTSLYMVSLNYIRIDFSTLFRNKVKNKVIYLVMLFCILKIEFILGDSSSLLAVSWVVEGVGESGTSFMVEGVNRSFSESEEGSRIESRIIKE